MLRVEEPSLVGVYWLEVDGRIVIDLNRLERDVRAAVEKAVKEERKRIADFVRTLDEGDDLQRGNGAWWIADAIEKEPTNA